MTTKAFALDDLFTNPALVSDGVWEDFYGGSKLRIASKDNPKYKALLGKLARKNKVRMNDTNPDMVELIRDLTCEAMAHHLLLDWDRISLNGEDRTPYSPETGKRALMQSSVLYDFVDEVSGDYARFKTRQEGEVKKP